MGHDTRKFANRHAYEKAAVEAGVLEVLNVHKIELLSRRLIGKLKDGVWAGYDYGNFSMRIPGPALAMLISGKQTSSRYPMSEDDFAVVHGYCPERFEIESKGSIEPSSESPLHWVAYEANPAIGSIVHAHIVDDDRLAPHCDGFFNERALILTKMRSQTREGAEELRRLAGRACPQVIGMPFHDGGRGILVLGKDFPGACALLAGLYEDLELYTRKQLH